MTTQTKPFDISERTFAFALDIVRLSAELSRRGEIARVLVRQLVRSGTSIGANVEEAQAGQSRADFSSKYAIALKEARETRYWLRILAESGCVNPTPLSDVIRESEELTRILGAIVAKSKGTNKKEKGKRQKEERP